MRGSDMRGLLYMYIRIGMRDFTLVAQALNYINWVEISPLFV